MRPNTNTNTNTNTNGRLRAIVPSFNDDLLTRLLFSMERSEPGSSACVIVGDNGLSNAPSHLFPSTTFIRIPHNPFIHMQALNSLVAVTDPSDDLVVFGDDSQILTPNWHTNCQTLLSDWPSRYKDFGMMNFMQPAYHMKLNDYADWLGKQRAAAGRTTLMDPFPSPQTLPLCGSLIPRHVFDAVGPFDERFVGYGYDDIDYCFRLLHTGLKLGITDAVQIEHLGQISYERSHLFLIDPASELNRHLLYDKYGTKDRPRGFTDVEPHMNRQTCGCSTGDNYDPRRYLHLYASFRG